MRTLGHSTKVELLHLRHSQGGLANAQITLNVIDNSPIPSAHEVRGEAIAGRNLLLSLSGTDPFGGGLSYRITQAPRGLGTVGVAAITRRGSQWMLAYRSSASFSGTDSIKFIVIARDEGRSAEATARIRVQAAGSAISSANRSSTPTRDASGDASAGRS